MLDFVSFRFFSNGRVKIIGNNTLRENMHMINKKIFMLRTEKKMLRISIPDIPRLNENIREIRAI